MIPSPAARRSVQVRVAALAVALALLPALGACQTAPLATPNSDASRALTGAGAPSTATVLTAASSSSADDRVNRVLAISVDGLNPRAITQLGASKAPNFYRMMREGAWTFNARTEQELTKTLPNHTSMFTGRRVDEGKGGHGVDFNSDTQTTVHKAAGHYVASVFDVVHDRGGRTALYSAKTKFALYSRTWNTHGAKDRTGKDHGRAKIDRLTIDEDNARLVSKLTTELKSSPRQFTFLHISLPDEVGHADGFMSKDYVEAVRQTDVLLGQVLTAIDSRPTLRKEMLVVLTADHGGNGLSHSKASSLQNYRVPFMVWGPGVGVPAGRDLYKTNKSFRDPKTSRPSYKGKQPIRNGDVANLVTDVLDLPPVPGSTLDRPRTLNVFKR